LAKKVSTHMRISIILSNAPERCNVLQGRQSATDDHDRPPLGRMEVSFKIAGGLVHPGPSLFPRQALDQRRYHILGSREIN
jgi:hypothetical protein